MTLEKIEARVVEHFTKFGMNHPPRFVLLDKKSYKKLCDSLRPMERANTNVGDVKVTKLNTGGVELSILPIDTKEEMFEVVG